ncbi:MAG TPA: M56 family metallopeptidase [Tepidisphaeraceae bacterium]|nr:M56 family metallopeptidase [Tepidisphaeraceae bacterium]
MTAADLRTDWAWADALAAWALRAGWQAAALAAIVAAVLYLAGPRIPPAWRFGLWALVLARLAIPPLITVPHHWLPAFGAAPTPATREPSDLSRDGHHTALARTDPSPGLHETPLVHDAPLVQDPRPITAASMIAAPRIAETAAIARPPTPRPTESGTSASLEPSTTGRPIARALVLTWLAGVLLLLARTALATARLARAVRRLPRVTHPRLTTALAAAATEMRLRRPPVALALPAGSAAGPALVGVVRPRLLLPIDALADLSDAELRLVLLHELAHVRRRDVLWNWLAALVAAAHWFNPIGWLAAWRMRVEREAACDHAVLAAGHTTTQSADPARLYAGAIVKLLERLAGAPASSPPSTSVALFEGKSQVHRRLVMIARFAPTRGNSHRRPVLAALAATVVGAGALLGVARAADPAHDHPAGTPAATKTTAPTARPAPDLKTNATTLTVPGTATTAPAGHEHADGHAPAAPGVPARPGFVPAGAYLARQAPADPAVAKANERMATTIAADFEKASLKDVLDSIRDRVGVDMMVDWNSLNSAGLEHATPVTLRLKNPLRADDVLALISRSFGGQLITETTRGGVIVVSAGGNAVVAEGPMVTRTYDVTDLVADGAGGGPEVGAVDGGGGLFAGQSQPRPASAVDQLISVITRTVRPDAWADSGGQYTVTAFRGKLIVKAPEAIHKEMTDLLDMLRAKPAAKVK